MAELAQRDPAKAERILGAARELLLKRGIRGFTVAEIAERAHVGKGTVYLYWGTKEDLFVGLFARDFLASVEECIAELGRDPQCVLPHRLCQLVVKTAMKHPFVMAVQTQNTEILGLLAEHPQTRQFFAELGPDAMLRKLLPLWRRHDMARQDWDLDEQGYAIRALTAGFFEAATSPAVLPALGAERKDAVLAATVRAVLEVGEPTAEQIADAAAEGMQLLQEARQMVLASLAPTEQ
jgi:AcrR family transcriptional regulator